MIASDKNTILIEEELNRVGALINAVYRDFEWERAGAIIDNILKRNGGVIRQTVFHELEGKSIFLRENCGRIKPVTLKDCAAALGFNPSYLSGMFSLRTGAPFHRYLLNLRLKKAEWLLVSGEMPVSEVALQSGFSSDKTFYRVFREQYGLSPGDYRKKQRRMSGEPTTIV